MAKQKLNVHQSSAYVFAEPSRFNIFVIACAGVLLLAFSFYTVQESEKALDRNVGSKLKTVLRIESEAVRQWQKSQNHMVQFLASDPQLVELAAVARGDSLALETDDLTRLSERFGEHNFLVATLDGKTIAKSGDYWHEISFIDLMDTFCDAYSTGQPSNSRVFCLNKQPVDSPGFCSITLSPIRHRNFGVVGFLAVGHELSDELTDVLSSSRSGYTGEVLAVSQRGQIISQSRFGNRSGTLDFYRRVHGEHLNRKSAETVVNLKGQTDHRGESVVTASRWLPDLGVGLVAKMDVSESLAPVAQIRRFVWTLFGLLLLTTVSTLVYRCYLYRLRRLAKKADLNSKRIGAYLLEDKIGEGGMGVVYKANHALLKRPTAVKILPPERSSPNAISRFEREVQLSSQLQHPNTISIYDYGRTNGGLFYYAMELLGGMNLDQLVRKENSICDGRVISILAQIGESLKEAHQMGLVHRDIKPSNIMLCNRGGAYDTVKVLDFGMVREIGDDSSVLSSNLSGTPTYMAPELFNNEVIADFRADIFAVGAVGFFLLSGTPLFPVRSFGELVNMHRTDLRKFTTSRLTECSINKRQPISPFLIELISSCTANSADDRPVSIEQFLNQLLLCKPMVPWHRDSAMKWWNQLESEQLTTDFDYPLYPNDLKKPLDEFALDETQTFQSKAAAGDEFKDRLVQC